MDLHHPTPTDTHERSSDRPDRDAMLESAPEQLSPRAFDTLRYARRLIGDGWSIYLLRERSKGRPIVEFFPNGFRSATTDLDVIRAGLARHPKANLAAVLPRDVAMIDVDARSGGIEGLAGLERRYSALPPTMTILTGGGGEHRFFTYSGPLRHGLEIAPGVEVLVGSRCGTPMPPALHPSGEAYRYVKPRLPIARLPLWTATLLRPEPPRPPRGRLHRPASGRKGDATGLLRWACDRVRHAPEGERHRTLRNMSLLAGGWCETDALEEETAIRELEAAREPWGMASARKDARTIRSAIRCGRQRPLRVR